MAGPWKDPTIMKQLEKRLPSIPSEFLCFDIGSGNADSLKALEGVHVSSLNVDSNFDDFEMSKSLEKELENEASMNDEINQLTARGLNIVE